MTDIPVRSVCLCFQVHQPQRLIPFDFFHIGGHTRYEDEKLNRRILSKVADRCYLPVNRMFSRIIPALQGRFRMALSISGTVLDQMRRRRPDVLDSFRDLVASGGVELLAETRYHSLAMLCSKREFERQVDLHLELLEEVFHVRPRVFRNTELIYNNALAAQVEALGFDGILAEGVPWVLNGKSPNRLYRAPNVNIMRTLLRNPDLSDDLGFRFSDQSWSEYPLTPRKFTQWLTASPGDVINLFMDYETIGEHQWEDTGIFSFWEQLPALVLDAGLAWITPSEAVDFLNPRGRYDCHSFTSWADTERDLSAWTGNVMQQEAIARIQGLEADVMDVGDPYLTHVWAGLQTSDHFYWMSTKGGTDGGVHTYFSPYGNPYDAYIHYMNAVADFQLRLQKAKARKQPNAGRGNRHAAAWVG